MALRIFETDPDAKPKERQSFSDDTVGRFHSGKAIDGTPLALTEWRVSTGDPEVADAVAQLFGGSPVENEGSTSENFIDVETSASKVQIILDGPSAIYADMKLWNRGKLVHHCDGVNFLSPDEKKGRPCYCPELMAERKAASKDYTGPAPSITITFRLADDPELGMFKFQTGSWTLAEVLHEAEDKLARIEGEALAELEIEEVEYVAKKGPMKGKTVSFCKPVLRVVKSYSAAVADPR